MGRVLSFLTVIGAPIALFLFWAARSSGYLGKKPALSAEEKRILTKYAIHYQRIPPKEQPQYEGKVALFMNDKTWVGAGIDISTPMKVMISACAAQLLQGFPNVKLTHFERIVVFPNSYRSPRNGQMHQGEVNPGARTIIISWADFVKGYAHPRNAFNVGLHEMAHALWFENAIENGEDHFLDGGLLHRWNELAHAEALRIRDGHHRFFRSYAGTNEAEFFAVAVEYFFEQPKEFRSALPELYGTLSGLIRQDPALPSTAPKGS